MFEKIRELLILYLVLLVFPITLFSQNTPEHDLIVSVERIWDRAGHNAFTSLIDYNGKLYCAFRESSGHVSDINGTIRVIASDDGQNWYSVAHIFERGYDLRDPQLSVTPDNRIMLNIGGSIYTGGKLTGMEPQVSFSDTTGRNFSSPQKIFIDEKIKSDKDWLWKATWHKGTAYATAYQPSKEKSVQLLKSSDGVHYNYVTTFDVIGGNETTLSFTADGKMIAVVRCDKMRTGYIGSSEPPYREWTFNKLQARVGGPNLILLDNGVMLCATREYPPDHNEKTILAKVGLDGEFIKLVTLPSGGDCSYPGLVMRDSLLYVSYYSSHEEKTAIYLAKLVDLKYGYDSFERVPEPVVLSDKNGIVELSCKDNQAVIKYTLDGSMPTTLNGYTYKEPIKIDKTTLLRAIAVRYKYPESNVLSQYVGTDIYQKSQQVEKNLSKGLKYEYYEGKVKNTSEISELTKMKTGVVPSITAAQRNRDANYAFIFTGYIKVPEDGLYTFYLTSNDGSRFYLNDELAINNDGAHGKREESVSLSLRKGYHKLQLSYFQLGGGQDLILEWSGEKFKRENISSFVFYH
ncbi:MAG: hypothetical protein GXO85_16230 [Chlorobi bacterium]|nr:hypothetical protein [Chlorobiota bacterium]